MENIEAVSEFEFNINYWINESANITLQTLFEKIINRGGVLKEIMESPDRTWLMQVLISFFDFIKEESMKNAKLSLKVFLRTLEKMEMNKMTRMDIIINDIKIDLHLETKHKRRKKK